MHALTGYEKTPWMYEERQYSRPVVKTKEKAVENKEGDRRYVDLFLFPLYSWKSISRLSFIPKPQWVGEGSWRHA